jgi:ABC-2 type transport system permease protein
MTLLNVLNAEMLKLRRTIAVPMVVIAPTLIALFLFVMGVNAPFTTLNRNGVAGEWTALTRASLRFWVSLMLPLLITLETALLAGLEHSESQWKSLLARPLPRWNFYAVKLLVGLALIAASSGALVLGILLNGMILPRVQSQLLFALPVPWLDIVRQAAEVLCLAFLLLAIQNWIALRWKPFSVTLGVGILGLVTGFFMFVAGQQGAKELQLFPWSLPMLVLGSRTSLNVATGLIFSVIAGTVVAAVGCWDFCRREVQ